MTARAHCGRMSNRIKLLLPHRAPMLFVEKLADIVLVRAPQDFKAG